ncbi:S-adenosyl-L-methionine-dependent methyltransferase [Aspergillus steynii IBT 23096]|uniref:S-adenosyl-L-methionine-dependent methyltransferase n=1 Tax=Aspergillus steynii IBT 23096 TaxID=1392250 RepID=A0A2I2GD24_9EURO|nr:S-adenosyl-L-methionine-dependent methyltransferase [Aspergillus steynii IBT 23096]PLB50788.1 S-adenosyl-L-methionine-dependent methyltransferase [Aspergillus steynii IBT 23096]
MQSEIGRLASIISQATATLDASDSGYSASLQSFEAESSPTPPPTAEETKAKSDAINACTELLDRLQGPLTCLLPLWNGASLQAISRYRIANHVPRDGEISYQDLSQASGVHVHDLKQYIRFAIVYHRLFFEKRKGYISHSAGSRALVENPCASAGVAQIDEWYGCFSKTVDAMDQFPGHKPDESGYALTHNNQNIFSYLSTRPDKAEQFAKGMQFFSIGVPEASPKYFVSGYPWSDMPAGATVVDIGGSNGHVGRLIAATNPAINVVVQDLSYAADEFKAAARGNELRNIRFDVHDFFTPQTVVADVYIFRWTLMNWPDESVVDILQQLVPVMRPGAKVLVNENLCPDSGALPLAAEKYIRWVDMLMLGVYKSRIRDEEEWAALFKQVDARFSSVRCSTVPGSALGIVEATWAGSE